MLVILACIVFPTGNFCYNTPSVSAVTVSVILACMKNRQTKLVDSKVFVNSQVWLYFCHIVLCRMEVLYFCINVLYAHLGGVPAINGYSYYYKDG